jgi:hypothetical protein
MFGVEGGPTYYASHNHGRGRRAMASEIVESNVKQLVADHWKGANVQEIQINERLPRFFRGTLYIVSIYDAERREHLNYVYKQGNDLFRYDSLEQVGTAIGKSPSVAVLLHDFFQFAGISGLVAIIITITICYLAIQHGSQKDYQIPEILKNALAIILGFYFGSAMKKPA